MRHRCIAGRSGFTLIELMVVMAIIAVLMSFITVAVFMARTRGLEAEQYAEITNLHSAVEMYRTAFGGVDPPPDGGGGFDAINRHIGRAFNSRRRESSPPPDTITPATALPFWLSQINKDPTDPFRVADAQVNIESRDNQMRHIFFQFDERRIVERMYFPPGSDIAQGHPPYVYFQFSTYDMSSYAHGDMPAIFPYQWMPGSGGQGYTGGSASGREFCHPESFQIISAGLDRKLGTGGVIFSEREVLIDGLQYIQPEDEDNIVNFHRRPVGRISR